MEVDVSAREHVRQALAANVVLGNIFFHSSQCQRTGRFRYRTHILEEIFHRRTDRIAVDGDDVVKILLAQTEGFVANTFYRHAFGK